MIGWSTFIGATRYAGQSAFTPVDLGTDLLAWWDADDLSAGAVSSWVDRVAGYNAAQDTADNQPVKGDWGVAFDGTKHRLTMESQPFPSGDSGSEIWVLVDQVGLSSVAGGRAAVSYGGATNVTMRRVVRVVTSLVNRAQIVSGDGASSITNTFGSVDFSGRHVVRGVFSATGISLSVDGSVLNQQTSVVSATGTTRVRIGASTLAIPNIFWHGDIAVVIITNVLSDIVASRLASYLGDRA